MNFGGRWCTWSSGSIIQAKMKFSAFWWTKIDDMIKNYIFLVRNFKLKIDYIRNRVKIFEFLLEFRKFRYCRPKKLFWKWWLFAIEIRNFKLWKSFLAKWGASSRWSSFLYFPKRNTDQMAIGETRPTLRNEVKNSTFS